MGYDGTVKIGTELDSSGVKKGLDEINGTAQSGFSKFSEIGKNALSVFAGNMLTGVVSQAKNAAGAVLDIGMSFESGMSKVEAISGATGEDLAALTDKAKEMGAKTKFSATESAEAMQYMAMAGWKTSDMLNGIEGIMNLAAASGEDLATTSDIVTDALTAFGLSAQDSTHFADILAQASSNANTNVSMMGETFKYVAPVAGAMGYSAEDVALAVGLMANSGIKASQAGTSLKAALVNMVKPTDDMRGVMERLGISIQNADGSIKPFGELIGDLRDKFAITTDAERAQNYAMAEQKLTTEGLADSLSGLSGEQRNTQIAYLEGIELIKDMTKEEIKAQAKQKLGIKLTKERQLSEQELYQLASSLGKESLDGMTAAMQEEAAATLFGKEAMSGMLAIINASDADYEKLAGSIENCDGAAAAMAETMQNNLEGQLTIFRSAREALAQEIYESIQEPLKNLTKVGIEAVSNLTQGFSEGGVMGMIEAAGQMANAFAENLPSIIEQGLPLVEGFTENLRSNAGKLVDGGIDLMLKLAQGLMDGLPSMLQHVPQIVINIAGIINDNAPKLLMAGVELIGILAKGLIQAIPDLIAALPQIIQAIAATIQAFNWLALGSNIITLLKNGITSMVGAVQSAGTGIFNAVKGAIQNLPQTLLSIGKNGGTGILNGLKGMVGSIKGAATSILTGIVSALTSLPSKLLGLAKNGAQSIVKGFTGQSWGNIGKNIITGITAGITGSVGKLAEAAKNAAKKAFDAAKDFLGIHSPSKLMRDVIGKNMIAGFESGIVAETPNLEKTSAGSAQRAVESMQGIALQRSGTVVAGNQVPPAPTPGGGQGNTVVVLEKGSITGDVTMDGEKVGTLVAPTVDIEIERARKESER